MPGKLGKSPMQFEGFLSLGDTHGFMTRSLKSHSPKKVFFFFTKLMR